MVGLVDTGRQAPRKAKTRIDRDRSRLSLELWTVSRSTMPKARKRKAPVTSENDHSSTSSKAKASRTVIRRFHVLLKKQKHLQNETRDAESARALADIEKEIEELGGLSAYQRMSSIGQGSDRGGGSEKILVGWLKELGWNDLGGRERHRCDDSLHEF